jgi:ADP-ribose pyrophosphatase YjhB (NUDIX family)
MAVIQRPRDGALLVSEEMDPAGQLFHRPLGGHVEFSEYARDTVHREFREEIGQALTGWLAGVLATSSSGVAPRARDRIRFHRAFTEGRSTNTREQVIADDQAAPRSSGHQGSQSAPVSCWWGDLAAPEGTA